MPKYYCSKCGLELTHTRKAVKGKGVILDLIEPHECEGYAIKSDEFSRPTAKDIIEAAKTLDPAKLVSTSPEERPGTINVRDERKGVRSTAPASLIDAINTNKLESGGE